MRGYVSISPIIGINNIMPEEHPKLSALPLPPETADHQKIGIERPHKLISHAGRFYVQKLRVQYKLDRAQYELDVVNRNNANPNQDPNQNQRPDSLKNVIIKPSDDNPLEYPVFIGENGIPIVLFQSDTAVLGRGGFGEVYLGVEMDDFSKVHAVKVYHKNEKNEPEIRHEAEVLSSLGKLIETLDLVSEGIWFSVQELAPGEPLNRYIHQNKPLNREALYKLMMAILTAVDSLHKKHGILHRDLKLENMMYDPESGTLTLIDYGSSISLEDKSTLTYKETKTNIPQTFLYVAPSLFMPRTDEDGTDYHEYSDKTEIYALGVIFAQLLAGATTGLNDVLYFQQGYAFTIADPKPEILPSLKTFIDKHIGKVDENDENYATLFELIKIMIHTDNDKRPDIESIKNQLQALWNDYHANPLPEPEGRSNNTQLDFGSIIPLPRGELDLQLSLPPLPEQFDFQLSLPLPEIVFDPPEMLLSFPIPKAGQNNTTVMEDATLTSFQPEEARNENAFQEGPFQTQLKAAIEELNRAISHYSPKQVSKKARLERTSSLTFSFSNNSQSINQSIGSIQELTEALTKLCDKDTIDMSELLQAGINLVQTVSQQYCNTEGFAASKLYQHLKTIEQLITHAIEQTPQYQQGVSHQAPKPTDSSRPGKS